MHLHFGRTSGTIFNRANFYRSATTRRFARLISVSTQRASATLQFSGSQFTKRVRDQFPFGCYNQRIRKRLLQDPDEATLERVKLEAPGLGGRPRDASISAVGQQYSGRKQLNGPSSQRTSGPSSSSAAPCSNCNQPPRACVQRQPLPGEEQGLQCLRQVGHFSVSCRSSTLNSGRSNHRFRQ